MPDVSHEDYTVIDVPVVCNDIYCVHFGGTSGSNVTVVLSVCWRDCVPAMIENWLALPVDVASVMFARSGDLDEKRKLGIAATAGCGPVIHGWDAYFEYGG